MNIRLAMGAGLFLWWVACGEVCCAEPLTLRSHSGQFLVRGLPLNAPWLAPAPNSPVTYVRLDPTLLAVSCERIKAAVLEELAMKDVWRGKVYISLHPVHDDREPIVVTSMHYADGWHYRMEIPEQVDATRLLKSVVEVLLMEIANRNARGLEAELPLWLTEGLTAHLQATALSNFTLEPETRTSRQQRGLDPLRGARERLRAHAPLTFNELNWPAEEQLSEANLETYQSCAQLFVSELLHLGDGRACLCGMLARLPENLNWQTAFLRAFGAHFQRLIDVDKWWSLHVVHLTGQGLSSVWLREESCKQLDEILTTAVEVRLSAVELPLPTQVKLQSILTEWDFQRQRPVILQKLNLLQVLRLRASEGSAGLVEGYHRTLAAYLQKRTRIGGPARPGKPAPAVTWIVNDTLKQLDGLDAQRETLRKQTNAPVAQLTASP